MDIKERIERARKPSRLAELLEKKQDRTLDEANELIDLLAGHLATQGASVIDVRDKMIEHKDAIERLANHIFGPEEPTILGVEKPKLII